MYFWVFTFFALIVFSKSLKVAYNNKNHDIKEYSFFGMEHFVLSLREEDIEEKILPEYWLAMSKNVGDKFFESRYKDNFIPISYKKVKNLYNKFKSVFM